MTTIITIYEMSKDSTVVEIPDEFIMDDINMETEITRTWSNLAEENNIKLCESINIMDRIMNRIQISYNILPCTLTYNDKIDYENDDLGEYTHIDLNCINNVDNILLKISKNKSLLFLQEIDLSYSDVSFEGLNYLKNIEINNYFIREKLIVSGRFGHQVIQLNVILSGTNITKDNGDNRWMLNNSVQRPVDSKIKVLYLDNEDRTIDEAHLMLYPIF